MTKFKILVDDGIVKEHTNGGRKQTRIFKLGVDKYKISIRSESYEFQSYARLYKWSTEKGWVIITSKQPKRDYKIDISYSESYKMESFKPIIDDLTNLAKEF